MEPVTIRFEVEERGTDGSYRAHVVVDGVSRGAITRAACGEPYEVDANGCELTSADTLAEVCARVQAHFDAESPERREDVKAIDRAQALAEALSESLTSGDVYEAFASGTVEPWECVRDAADELTGIAVLRIEAIQPNPRR